MTLDRQRLQRLFGSPALAPLLDALQAAYARGGPGVRLHLKDLEPAQRAAIEDLLGRPPGSGPRLQVPVERLEAVIRASGAAPELAAAVAALRGPLRDLRGERRRREQAWAALCDPEAIPADLRPWLADLQGSGLLRRLAGGDPERGRELLDRARRVITALPAGGDGLALLAARTLGDAHALDPGRPEAALVRRWLLLEQGEALLGERPGEALDALWAAVGVLPGGGLTSRVLILGLKALDDGPTARLLNTARAAGEPLVLTLGQLRRAPPTLAGGEVHVCENPSVVAAAAARLGPACRSLICTEGQPSGACLWLLQALAGAGCPLAYHGDFDWPGIAIANRLLARPGFRPWRFGREDYLAAAPGRPLGGRMTEAVWDPGLTRAMQERGVVVEEELVVEDLLADLDTRGQKTEDRRQKAGNGEHPGRAPSLARGSGLQPR